VGPAITTTLIEQGQITIPQQIRDSAGLKAGCRLTFDMNSSGELVLRPEEPVTDLVKSAKAEALREKLERAIGSAEIKWEGGTDAYMALLRGENG
jgi:AbrB family looped-hinge helix DNA binding protein